MKSRCSDSDSSAEHELLQERRTLIDFAQMLSDEDDRDDDDDDDDNDHGSDSDYNLIERNAVVTFDGHLSSRDDTDTDSLASGSAAGGKSKTWANRLLRRAMSKPANGDKKVNTLGHFKTSGFSRARAESPTPQRQAREPRHFHLKRNRPTKQEVKPTPEPVLRYRLCPYALPSLHEVHAHFGSELNSMNALPKGDVDDRNSKYSSVIAMHFQELVDVARTMNKGSPKNGEMIPENRSTQPATPSSPSSPERRKSVPAKAGTVSAIEQARMEMRHSEITHRTEEFSRSFSNTTPSGFTFASVDDPIMIAFEEEGEEQEESSPDADPTQVRPSDDHRLLSRMSELRLSLKTPPPKESVRELSLSSDDLSRSPATNISQPPTTKPNRFRKIGQFRSKHADEHLGGTNGEADPNSPRTYTLAQLQTASGPLPGVNILHKEDVLSNEEFEKTFKCTRDHFKALPQWRRNMLKKEHGLF